MRLWVHHLNIASGDQKAMHEFYRNVIGLDEMSGRDEARHGQEFYPGDTTYVTDGEFEFHIAQKDHNVGFRIGQHVNPVDRGHLAFRTDDLEGFKRHLEAKGIPYSDYGNWAMGKWTQIFFYDPAGNVIEVHQDLESAETGPPYRRSESERRGAA